MRRMLTAKLQNRSGVLNRFTGVLSRRQVNIESISVGATENPNVSRTTIIIDVASHDEVEQIIKQMTGNAEKSETLIRVIRPYGIKNIARTGATGFTRD